MIFINFWKQIKIVMFNVLLPTNELEASARRIYKQNADKM